MRKVAHYFYGCGHELVVSMEKRICYIHDQHGNHPYNPVYKMPHPHPSTGEEDLPSFEELGLFYEYDMSDTGWSGDC